MSGESFQVCYSPEAEDDLNAVYSYIAFSLHAKIAAEAQTNRIRDEIRSLSIMPERYERAAWEPWHSRGVRKLPVDNFVIFYLVNKEESCVDILRIFYGGRDIEEITG